MIVEAFSISMKKQLNWPRYVNKKSYGMITKSVKIQKIKKMIDYNGIFEICQF